MALERRFVEIDTLRRFACDDIRGVMGEFLQGQFAEEAIEGLLEDKVSVSFTDGEKEDIQSIIDDIKTGSTLGDKRDKLECICDVLICAERGFEYTTQDLLRTRLGWTAGV